MTTDLLRMIIEANLAAAAAIVFILALRPLVRASLGAKSAYRLWLLAPITATATTLPARRIAVEAQAAPVETFSWQSLADQAQTTAAAGSLDLTSLALLAWVFGAGLTAGWLVSNQRNFMADVAVGAAGPAVVGFLRPRIVTPADFEQRYGADERKMVLAHEQAHLARNDSRMNAALAALRCLFWFNPFIHIAAREMRIDQEMACDAQVLARHPKARRLYAEALLKTQLAARPLPFGCYWPAGTLHPLTERIAMLKRNTLSPARTFAGATLLAALAISGGLTAWAAQPPVPSLTNAAPPPEDTAESNSFDGIGARPPADVNTGAPVLLRGEITRVEWTSPNVWITIQSQQAEGVSNTWRIRGNTPETLISNGLSREQLALGTTIIVRGYQFSDTSCSPACLAEGRDITFPDNTRGSLVPPA